MSFEHVDGAADGSPDGATVSGTMAGAEDSAGPAERVSDPSDAFQALGNEIRLSILETVFAETGGRDGDRVSFSTLYDSSDVETSAGFAYHIDQLAGHYLRKHDDGYELTYAGVEVARAVETGTYTHRVDRPATALADACPFCERTTLVARSVDNVVTVDCEGCEQSLLRLPFPPSGLDAHGEAFPEAFDRYHRQRLSLCRDGICPDCSGEMTARLASPADSVADELPDPLADHVQAEFACDQCTTQIRSPVTVTLLDHPAIVSFYHHHGEDIQAQPIWNVGHEWAETIISTEPLAVRVSTTLDGDVLALYVGADATVVDVQHASADDST